MMPRDQLMITNFLPGSTYLSVNRMAPKPTTQRQRRGPDVPIAHHLLQTCRGTSQSGDGLWLVDAGGFCYPLVMTNIAIENGHL